jgi:predicted GNAT family N-acyltransferase
MHRTRTATGAAIGSVLIRPPANELEFDAYYSLRWKMLRKPWNQPATSEKDEFESEAFHLGAWTESGDLIAVGRLHRISENCAQIRYMAVDPSQRSRGVGTAMLRELESFAVKSGVREIKLNARQEAVQFYLANGYELVRPSHRLFGLIQHFEMQKQMQATADRLE